VEGGSGWVARSGGCGGVVMVGIEVGDGGVVRGLSRVGRRIPRWRGSRLAPHRTCPLSYSILTSIQNIHVDPYAIIFDYLD